MKRHVHLLNLFNKPLQNNLALIIYFRARNVKCIVWGIAWLSVTDKTFPYSVPRCRSTYLRRSPLPSPLIAQTPGADRSRRTVPLTSLPKTQGVVVSGQELLRHAFVFCHHAGVCWILFLQPPSLLQTKDPFRKNSSPIRVI